MSIARYAVIGNPIAHSRSPEIHAVFAEQTGQAMEYERIQAANDTFLAAARRFFATGGLGLNVTLPFKQDAAAFATMVSEGARLAGAVNTLTLQDHAIAGDNTDGVGLLRDLQANFGVDPAGRRVLVLGAGGAVRGVVAPLLGAGVSALVIANRSPDKASALAQLFADQGPVTTCALADAGIHGPFDLVINAISAGLYDHMPTLPDGLFAHGAAAYDMIYANTPTPFLRWAADQGVARRRDGFGMLVEQAAESFYIWRGIRPKTRPVIARLRPGG